MEVGLGHRHLIKASAVDVVGHTDWDLADAGEHVELGEEQIGKAVDAGCITGNHRVVPTTTALTAGVHSDFAAGGLQELAPLVEQFSGEGAGTNAGGVGLDDTQGAGDLCGADTGSHAGAAGSRVGGGHEGVGAVVDVQHGCLAALHQHMLALIECLVELQFGLDNHGAQAVGVGQEVLHNFLSHDGFAVVHLYQDLVLDVQRGFDLLAQDGFVKDVLDADTDAGDLIGVGRADAAAGGADGTLA